MISIVIVSSEGEASFDDTRPISPVSPLTEPGERVAIDASSGLLHYIRHRHAATPRWLDFQPPNVAELAVR